jgi:hypothetical protein
MEYENGYKKESFTLLILKDEEIDDLKNENGVNSLITNPI